MGPRVTCSGSGPRASEDDSLNSARTHVTRNRERPEKRPRSIFERQAVGWVIVIALGLLALIGLVLAFAALPLLVAAFPLTIAAVLIVLAIGYVRHRRTRR